MFGGRNTLRDELGQTGVEYAAVIALVALLMVLAFSPLPSDLFTSFWSAVQSAIS
jgi:Flp pilus assembly pilin Flp